MGAVKTGVIAYASEASTGAVGIAWTTSALTSAGSGVTIPPKYINNMAVAGTAAGVTITTTIQGTGDTTIDTTTLRMGTTDPNLQLWTWVPNGSAGTTLPAKYVPKN
jgi:hypothetical protein